VRPRTIRLPRSRAVSDVEENLPPAHIPRARCDPRARAVPPRASARSPARRATSARRRLFKPHADPRVSPRRESHARAPAPRATSLIRREGRVQVRGRARASSRAEANVDRRGHQVRVSTRPPTPRARSNVEG
jgi:hypothetical protein